VVLCSHGKEAHTCAKTLIGVAASAATITSAAAQQVELVPFRSVDNGVVIEVSRKLITKEIAAAQPTEAAPLSAEVLAQDLAGMVSPHVKTLAEP
jgi:hypothetical protein